MIEQVNCFDYKAIEAQGLKLVLYGAGQEGKSLLGFLEKLHIELFAFCDSNPLLWGTFIQGHEVLSPGELNQDSDYFIVVTVWNNAAKQEIYHSLMNKNIRGKILLDNLRDKLNIGYFFDETSERFVLANRAKFVREIPWYFHLAYEKYPDAAYIDDIWGGQSQIYLRAGYYKSLDVRRKYFSITEGKRTTTDLPDKYEHRLIFLGDSRMQGFGLEDRETIVSCVQRLLNERYPDTYQCENYSMGAYNFATFDGLIRTIEFGKDDIVLCQMTAVRGYEKQQQIPNGVLQEYIDDMINYVIEKGGKIVFLFMGSHQPIRYIKNKSYAEEFIMELFGNDSAERRFIDSYVRRPDDSRYWESYVRRKNAMFIDCMEVLQELPEHPQRSYFLDEVHLGTFGARLIAKEIFMGLCEQNILYDVHDFSRIRAVLRENDRQYIYPLCAEKDFNEYLRSLEMYKSASSDGEKCGAIVMNANPFTKGHRYLVEQAAEKVGHLYIFVLEEDQSRFKFEDRFEMVKLGVSDITNVTVIKSGRYIISNRTFPEYFAKKEEEADCSVDIGIWCNFIAPVLGIKKRFVGTEPFSVVTNSYNEQLKKLLPMFDMELIEIERLSLADIGGVSATKVRDAMETGDMRAVKMLVPETTYNYLQKNISGKENLC